MTNETNYRTKANAVFFAAIMVVSMIAVGFAAAPAAAVTVGNNGLSASTGSDIPVDSAGTQDVTFNIDVESGDTAAPVTLDVSDTSDFSSLQVQSVTSGPGTVTIADQGTISNGLHTLTVTENNGGTEVEDATITVTYSYDSTGASAGSAAHDIYVDQTDASGEADGSASYTVTTSAAVGGIAASTTDADPGQQVEVTGVETENNDDHVAVWTTDSDDNPETFLGSTQVNAAGPTAVTVGLTEPYTSEQDLIAAVHSNDGGSPNQGQIYATASGTVTPTAAGVTVSTAASEIEPGQSTTATATASYEGTNDETGTADVTSDVTFVSSNPSSVTVNGNTLFAQSEFGQSNIGLDNAFQSVQTADVTEATVTVTSDASGGSGDAQIDYGAGDFAYQGQDVVANVEDTDLNDEQSVRLREVDSFDNNNIDSSSNVRELTVESASAEQDTRYKHVAEGDLIVTIETDDLESGDYFVRGGNINEIRANTFEVGTQSLSVEFDDDSVNDDGSQSTTDLDIESNRADYSMNVSADGDLSEEDLFNIFAPNADYDNATDADNRSDYDESQAQNIDPGNNQFGQFGASLYQTGEDDADEKIVLYDFSDDEYEVDFQNIDTGDYDIDFNSTDTEASDVGSITVEEQDTGASWDQGVYTQSAGDVQEVTLELEDSDDAYVQFGDEDTGYVDILYVEDDDDDDEVTFQINTRVIGDDGEYDAFYSDDDIVESMAEDSPSDNFDGVTFYDEDVGEGNYLNGDDEATLNDYRSALDVEALVRPLQPTDYNMAVNGNGNFIVNDDDESELDDELDLATLDLTEPSLGDVTTWTAPADNADENDNLTEVLDTVTERSDIAEDDRAVIQVEASGLYGAMVAQEGNNFDALDDGFEPQTIHEVNNLNGEGITIEIESEEATGNQDTTEVDFNGANSGDVFTLVDNEAGEMFIIVDTSSSSAFSGSFDTGDSFTASVEYETDSDNRYRFAEDIDADDYDTFGAFSGYADGDSESADASYPYFPADSTTSTEGEFTIADQDAEFDNVNNDTVEVEVSETAEISGETNVAPGSSASVRVRSDDGVSPSFVETTDAEISEDGSFSAEFDFSGQSVDDTGTVNFRVEGSSIADSDMVLIEEVEEEDGEDGSDDGEDGEDGTDDGEDGTDDGEDGSDDGEDGTDDGSDGTDDGSDGSDGEDGSDGGSEDGTPGFGALVALVALIAAALLATRRNE